MLQKYKLPFIVKPLWLSLLKLFVLGLFFLTFQGCRISDIESYGTDDAYFMLADLRQSNYTPLMTSTETAMSDSMTNEFGGVSSGLSRDAFGNLIISSGEPALNYEEYYDFSYSSRIRRFGQTAPFSDYFSPWYTEHYWYSHETPYWGTNIYETTPWNWFGMGTFLNPFRYSWWLNSAHSYWAWPNSIGLMGGNGHVGSAWNAANGSNSNPVLYRKRTATPTLNSSFSGFSYSGRPAERPAVPSSTKSERPVRPAPTERQSSQDKSPESPILRAVSPSKIPNRVESSPVNSATRFDNRKENGLIKEEVPTSAPRRVPPAPATNTGRKATFGEGSRSVPRSTTPTLSPRRPTYAPTPRSSSPPRPSSPPQRQSTPTRSTPSGQRPR